MIWLVAVTLVWTTPATRTDGTSLPPGDISHYDVYRNGEYLDTTHATSYVAPRSGRYEVRCVDTLSQESEPSNAVRLKGKHWK